MLPCSFPMAPSTALVLVPQPASSALTTAATRAGGYFRAAQAENTRRAYASDWKHFSAWCRTAGQGSLPAAPESLVLYLSTLAETAKVSTLTRRISAISQAHQAAGFETPTAHLAVRKLMAGIRRQKGTAQIGKRPLATADVRRLLAPLDTQRMLDVRDRALLLTGFAGAFRRSELVGVDVSDLEFNNAGLIVNIRRSKTDQEGQGRRVGLPYGSTPATCPVRALEAWLAVLGADDGPLFRGINRHGQLGARRLTAQSVALIIKRLAAAAGMEARDLAGHSLRAGLATAAAAAGVSERAIMAQTGHRSVGTLRKYIREGSLFLENAASKVGL